MRDNRNQEEKCNVNDNENNIFDTEFNIILNENKINGLKDGEDEDQWSNYKNEYVFRIIFKI